MFGILTLAIALGLGLSLFYIGLLITWYLFQAIAYWLIFVKAGESGWKSLIPIYNVYIQYKITWTTTIFWVSLILGILSPILANMEGSYHTIGVICAVFEVLIDYMAAYKFSKAFGHGIPFALGLVFLNPIFILILGFGSSEYYGPQ